jgi:membrane-bound lytic murein transglycosylase D
MNRFWRVVMLLLFLAPSAYAAETNAPAPNLIQSAQDWINDNIDLDALPELDEDAIKQFFAKIQQRFSGTYVLDLSGFKKTAQAILPLLQSREELQPYAKWLAVQIDYLDVADQISILSIPPPNSDTNAPPPARVNPTPQLEREIWIKKLADRRRPLAANQYLKPLKHIFAEQKVPPELVWLAEVESSFDRTARSPMGAAGLFQLMPDTAKRFGLSLWPRDQRYQPEPSATASAQYLKFLFAHFHDWRLALAAYNDGEGSIQKLLDRYQTQNYDNIAAHLPAETQMFVPRVEAVILKREGILLEKLPVPQP